MNTNEAKRYFFTEHQAVFSALRTELIQFFANPTYEESQNTMIFGLLEKRIVNLLRDQAGEDVAKQTSRDILQNYLIPQAKEGVKLQHHSSQSGFLYILGIALLVAGFLAYVFAIGNPGQADMFLAVAFAGILLVVAGTFTNRKK